MNNKTSKLLLTCNLWLVIHHVPLASSQETSSPLPSSCLAAPCTYRGECRDRWGICGDTVAHCNAESLWEPGCGGGLGLDKPIGVQELAPLPSPPVNEPTRRPTRMAPPTEGPTTAWEAWIGKGKDNQPSNEDHAGDEDQTAGVTAGNAGDVQGTAPTNDTEWAGFNADEWGYRGEGDSEDEGLLDKGLSMIGFRDDDENGSAMGKTTTELVFALSVVSAWMVLL